MDYVNWISTYTLITFITQIIIGNNFVLILLKWRVVVFAAKLNLRDVITSDDALQGHSRDFFTKISQLK